LRIAIRRGDATSPVTGLLVPTAAETLATAESELVTGTNRTDVPATPVPRRSAMVTVGPTESEKLHERNAWAESDIASC
jgi:hypothetical protein